MHAAARALPLVGRQHEVAVLEDACLQVSQRESRLVAITGEAGIGKTRLLDELDMRAASRDALTMRGCAIPVMSGELPYAPFITAMRQLKDVVGDEELWRAAGDLAPALAPLISSFDDEPDDGLEGERARFRMFRAFTQLLTRLGQERLVLLELEDMHWVDSSSLDLLSFLVRNLHNTAVLIVLTYRGNDPVWTVERFRIFDEILRTPIAMAPLDLPPLSLNETRQLARTFDDTAISEHDVETLHARARGVAFYTLELLRARELSAHSRMAPLVRLRELGPDGLLTLRMMATVGRPVSHDFLAAAMDPDELASGVRDAVDAGALVITGDTYSYRHWLMAEAVYEAMLPDERIGLHLLVAEAMRKAPEDDEAAQHAQLSHHWELARRYPDALQAAHTAARASRALHAYQEAGQQYDRAIHLWSKVVDPQYILGGDYCQLLVEKSSTCELAGDPVLAAETLEAALAVLPANCPPERLALLYEQLCRYLWKQQTKNQLAYDTGRTAVELLEHEPDSPAKARVLATHALIALALGKVAEGLETARTAVDVSRRLGTPVESAHALNALGVALSLTGNASESIAALEESVNLSKFAGDIESALRSYSNLGYVHEALGNILVAREVEASGREYGLSKGLALFEMALLVGNETAVLTLLGRWDEAEQLIQETLDSGLTAPGSVYLLKSRGEIALARGELAQASACLHDLRELSTEDREPDDTGTEILLAAELAWRSGDERAAWDEVEHGIAMLQDVDAPGPVLMLCSFGLRLAGDATARQRLRAGANGYLWERRADTLFKLVEEASGKGSLSAPAQAYAALALAEYTFFQQLEAGDAFRHAAELWQGLNRPYTAAYAQYRFAECLLRVRDKGGAARVLHTAARTARELRAELLLKDITDLAEAARLSIADDVAIDAHVEADAAPQPKLWPALTARETEVLQTLVDTGGSDREIARILFITPKTVSVHLSNIFRKFQVGSRGELIVAARREAERFAEQDVS
jgi:DNA-binding CsgD family transcriptional regulator/tetratricopeptide (TPR) repeat protein